MNSLLRNGRYDPSADKTIRVIESKATYFNIGKKFGYRDNSELKKIFFCRHCKQEQVDFANDRDRMTHVVTTRLVCTYCWSEAVYCQIPYVDIKK